MDMMIVIIYQGSMMIMLTIDHDGSHDGCDVGDEAHERCRRRIMMRGCHSLLPRDYINISNSQHVEEIQQWLGTIST